MVQRRASVEKAVLRVDAKAEGLVVAVGGWSPHYNTDGTIDTSKSPWFHVRLTERDAPWAFVKGLPARAISTLELLATLVGLVLLAPSALDARGAAGTVAVTGLTDSQVSSAVVTRGLTTTFPLCAVAMELSAQLERRGAELFLDWIPRDANKEADRLADGDSRGFSEERRVQASIRQINWLVLNELLEAGGRFYEQAQAEKKAQGKARAFAGHSSRRKRQRLKERDPW